MNICQKCNETCKFTRRLVALNTTFIVCLWCAKSIKINARVNGMIICDRFIPILNKWAQETLCELNYTCDKCGIWEHRVPFCSHCHKYHHVEKAIINNAFHK